MRRWHEAQDGSVRCRSIRWRSVPEDPTLVVSLRASTPDGGGDGGVPRMVLQDPLAPLHRRGARRVGRRRQDARLGQDTTPRRTGERDPAKRLADDAGDAVVSGQSLVDERVIRVEEIQHAAVLVRIDCAEEPRLLEHRRSQRFIEIGEEDRVGYELLELARLEPLGGESSR